MTGEEAIKAAETPQALEELAMDLIRAANEIRNPRADGLQCEDSAEIREQHELMHRAALQLFALRALLPLARTGLLVERTLAKPGVRGVEFNNPDDREPNPTEFAVFEMIQSEEVGIGFNRIAHAPTLAAAVEAALKGQQ